MDAKGQDKAKSIGSWVMLGVGCAMGLTIAFLSNGNPGQGVGTFLLVAVTVIAGFATTLTLILKFRVNWILAAAAGMAVLIGVLYGGIQFERVLS